MKLTMTIKDAFIRSVMDDVPSIDYRELIRKCVQDDAAEQLPPKVRAVYNDKELRGYLNSYYAYGFGVQVTAPDRDFRISDKAKAEYERLVALSKAQDEQRSALLGNLRAVTYSCSTLKQLQERLPEFAKYMPKDEKAAATINLPALANIVTDFMKAGWPKDQPKPQPAAKPKRKNPHQSSTQSAA